MFYLKQGLVKIAKGKIALYDKMARRYQMLRDLHCIHKTFDIDGLLDTHTISNSEHNTILEDISSDEIVITEDDVDSAPVVSQESILVDNTVLESERKNFKTPFSDDQFSLF